MFKTKLKPKHRPVTGQDIQKILQSPFIIAAIAQDHEHQRATELTSWEHEVMRFYLVLKYKVGYMLSWYDWALAFKESIPKRCNRNKDGSPESSWQVLHWTYIIYH